MQRFEDKVERIPESGCWVWVGVLWDKKQGYGRFNLNKKRMRAHRASYIIYKGEIPQGMLVCHTCDNPECVNPDHLYLGTPKDNSKDCSVRGRQKNGHTDKTHCHNGHLLSGDNLYINPASGARVCKKCKYEYNKEYYK